MSPAKKERPGVVESTIGAALRYILGAGPRPKIDTNGDDDVPTVVSLRKGSSNLWEASIVARLLLGEKKFPGRRKPLFLDQLTTWYERRLGWCDDPKDRVGHRGMEDVGTTYAPIHRGNALAIGFHLTRAGLAEHRLMDLCREWLSRELGVLSTYATGSIEGDREMPLQFATAGVRCTIPTEPVAAEFLREALCITDTDAELLDPQDKAFSPVAWLQDRMLFPMVDGTDGFLASMAWVHDQNWRPLFNFLAERVKFGIGALEVRRYDEGGVVAHFPQGIAGAAVGDAKKAARRPACVILSAEHSPAFLGSQIGFVGRTEITKNETLRLPTVRSFEPDQWQELWIPRELERARFFISHLDSAWPEDWPRYDGREV